MQSLVYLDNNSTTKVDPEVLAVIMQTLENDYGNASSTHIFGRKAKSLVNNSREQVANLIGCSANELVFTSGATEAINLAIKGLSEGYGRESNHIVTVQSEHPAVLETLRYLESVGFEITYLPVDREGLVNVELFKQAIKKNTLAACVMFVNNETGVIQPIKELAGIARQKKVYFISDATQAVGKIPVNVENLGVDLLCFSAHKFHGPKGVGALYIRSSTDLKRGLLPQMHGGSQEGGLRSGTLNVGGIAGFGRAAELASTRIEKEKKDILDLRNHFETQILKVHHTILNGSRTHRVHNVSNICFRGVDAANLMAKLRNVAVSNGSACTSEIVEPSHVLTSMGLSSEEAFSSIRFSLSRLTTKAEIEIVLNDLRNLLIDELVDLNSTGNAKSHE
jgi:cysteine desulfurase